MEIKSFKKYLENRLDEKEIKEVECEGLKLMQENVSKAIANCQQVLDQEKTC